MPRYEYFTDDGEVVEFFMSIAEMLDKQDENGDIVLDDGRTAHRNYGDSATKAGAGYPYLSDAMGVHPCQIPYMQKLAEEKGVPTEFTKDGRMVVRDRKHRKEFGERFGFFDKDGGYGDPRQGVTTEKDW